MISSLCLVMRLNLNEDFMVRASESFRVGRFSLRVGRTSKCCCALEGPVSCVSSEAGLSPGGAALAAGGGGCLSSIGSN